MHAHMLPVSLRPPWSYQSHSAFGYIHTSRWLARSLTLWTRVRACTEAMGLADCQRRPETPSHGLRTCFPVRRVIIIYYQQGSIRVSYQHPETRSPWIESSERHTMSVAGLRFERHSSRDPIPNNGQCACRRTRADARREADKGDLTIEYKAETRSESTGKAQLRP